MANLNQFGQPIDEPVERSTAASEAVFLLLQHIFDELGYHRCE